MSVLNVRKFVGRSININRKMVRAYYMDTSDEDQRLPHELSPPQNIDLETLYKKTGVLYFKVMNVHTFGCANL